MLKATVILIAAIVLACSAAFCQSPDATVAGRVVDTSAAVIPNAKVEIISLATGIHRTSETNREGSFVIPNLAPGPYRIEVAKNGFKTVIREDVVLHVQDVVALNFTLPIGSTTESVTVQGGAPLVNTQDATVSTVVDRDFAENLPLNGRSFQTLIYLTPGVVATPSGLSASGQFSVNGQRGDSNYWTVDGVSANVGIGVVPGGGGLPGGSGLNGQIGAYSVMGGTNSLVSVDALQEFRIETSTYAPEFGRTPGGQISIATRSGTNHFHGTAFDYLRNDILDANNWFNTFATPALPKARERQNDFGGTLEGPIFKDKAFFFFSYEGLRLELPETSLTSVPDASFTPGTTNSRANASPALRQYLNAYPLPNQKSPEILVPCDPSSDPACPMSGMKPTGSAALNASYSDPANLNALSLRLDYKLKENLSLFGRYNYSPSTLTARAADSGPLNDLSRSRTTTQTATTGVIWTLSSTMNNDFRFNYSRNSAESVSSLDSFAGGIPLPSIPNPSNASSDFFGTLTFSLLSGYLQVGQQGHNIQRQFNVVDSLSIQRGSHALKVGVDFRRLTPILAVPQYTQLVDFVDVPSLETGNFLFAGVSQASQVYPLFRNLGMFGQDTWRVTPRLTLTYGLRWDVDIAPSTTQGPGYPAVRDFDLGDLSKLALAPEGAPPFATTYGDVAPRIGVAYQLSQTSNHETVIRGGFGIFYDLATSEAGNLFTYLEGTYPFGSSSVLFGGTFPLTAAEATPPPVTPGLLTPSGGGTLGAFDPHLQLPYTREWNLTFEQGLGKDQALTMSYLGAAGNRLIQTAVVRGLPNPNIGNANLVTNAGVSNYNALQAQFQKRMSRGLQILASYTFGHSIDTASTGNSNLSLGRVQGDRGPSDFDIRNTFSAALTYDVPSPKINILTDAVLSGWSMESIVLARSAPPVDVQDTNFYLFSNILVAEVRPDVVPGQPLYLYGSQYPGDRAINPAAFENPPVDPSTGLPLRQGNLGRNALRGFGATQWDFAMHKQFKLRENVKLQFRAEVFNLLNHPNFAPPESGFGGAGFGVSQGMLGQYLGGNLGTGGFSPLYQIGGPRSMQLALKLSF